MWNCHRKEIRRSEGLTSKRQLSNLFTVFQALISQLLKLCVLLRWSIMYSNWIIATNLAIWLANLPMSVRVQTTLLATMCHAMPFSARAYVSVKSKRQHAPPGQPPGHLTFLKIIVQIAPYPGQNAVQMPHTRVHSGDQMPPTWGHFTGTKMTEERRKRLQLSNKIFINITKTEKHC